MILFFVCRIIAWLIKERRPTQELERPRRELLIDKFMYESEPYEEAVLNGSRHESESEYENEVESEPTINVDVYLDIPILLKSEEFPEVERFLRAIFLTIDYQRRRAWSGYNKEKEHDNLGDLYDDCEYVELLKRSRVSDERHQAVVEFYMHFDPFYHDSRYWEKYEEHPSWSELVEQGKRVLEVFGCEVKVQTF
jgi:hypothetical protein